MGATRIPLRLLVVDDEEDLRYTLQRRFQQLGANVTVASTGEEAIAKAQKGRFDVALLDIHLPGMTGIDLLQRLKEAQPDLEAIMLTAHSTVETAIQAMKQGAYDYLKKPFQLAELEVHVQKAHEKAQLARRQNQWLQQLRYESPRYSLVGSSQSMRRVVQLIERVAPTDSTVLVRGQSGTGKELVARALHVNSPRADHPLVTINCAALQETLLESELFGHEKGAFTGATQAKPGLVEVAEGGTLFIDEIAEMAPGLQAKLLRVLENGNFRRVGGTQEMHADVRVVAATNRPLETEIKASRFREDLFYRLNVLAIELPPLRERAGDIPELVEHFLTTRRIGPNRFTVHPDALAALTRYSWPGNVRELANVLERAQILAEGSVITVDDLPDTLLSEPADGSESEESESQKLQQIQRRHVLGVLRQHHGNKVHAARSLGISRRALYRLLEKYQIKPEEGAAEDQGE